MTGDWGGGGRLSLEGSATIQKDPDRLEEQVDRNLTKFIRDKCKALPLGKEVPLQGYRLCTDWLGSSHEEKVLKILVGRELSMRL